METILLSTHQLHKNLHAINYKIEFTSKRIIIFFNVNSLYLYSIFCFFIFITDCNAIVMLRGKFLMFAMVVLSQV